jgi:DNA repair protein RecO (recombination protein O)
LFAAAAARATHFRVALPTIGANKPPMDWTDEGLILALRPHGEHAVILEALTRAHGRHLGLVHGGTSSKRRAAMQPGNRVRLKWRARLAEHLGTFEVELAQARAHDMFDRRAALAGLNALAAVANAVLPEREPHPAAFEGADALIDTIAHHDFPDWAPLFVRWELGLLDELGFGLDLAHCVVTGATDGLAYVSPRSGRAVSAEGGRQYTERLLPLPQFLLGRQAGEPAPADLVHGLALTAHFLEQSVLAPHNKRLPEARLRLADLAQRESAKTESR